MAEQNLIKKADLARAREIDFTFRFVDDLRKLFEALGVTRKIPKSAGSTIKAYKATGVLENGMVPEGDLIPLSHYKTVPVTFREITLKKWRKATSAEAIIERGYDQAHNMTTNAMLKDIQKGIKTDFFTVLSTGTGRASGATFQAAIAQTWGKLQVLFEDTDIDAVYFMNQEDVADYLSTANITLQTAFGMTYVENFLGLGTVIFNSNVPRGTVYGTAKDNIIVYYVPVNGADLENAFEFTSDQTGYIGIHEGAVYNNMTDEDVAICGIVMFVERIDGVVVGTIGTRPGDLAISPLTTSAYGVSAADMQSGITIGTDGKITGTLKYLSGSNAITDVWGEGNFLALSFPDLPSGASSVKIGLDPSQGTGLVELVGAEDNTFGTFKIADPKAQVLLTVTTKDGLKATKSYDLSGLVCETDEA